MDSKVTQKWQHLMQIIRDNVGEERFRTWFSCAELSEYDAATNELTISLPSEFFKDKYETEFYSLFSKSLRHVYGASVKLSYLIGLLQDDAGSVVKYDSEKQSSSQTNKTQVARQQVADPARGVIFEDVDPQLNPKYNFDNYCVGESNKLAYTIASYIAEHPEKTEFNPFFLYGDVGVGKTHLIQSIGLRVKDDNPTTKVLYVTMRHFINQYRAESMANRQTNFINWYQNIDVLLIDDLQELSGKEGTMNALFPIFNHLHQNGKQLIFTCDRPPSELEGITDRLIDRFKWGITERLNRPDYELRKKILDFKSKKNGLALPEDIIEMIAQSSTGSVRELEGIVMGIITRAIRLNRPITRQLAMEVICHSVKTPRKKAVNFDMIVELTADKFNLNADVIFSKSRQRDIADARQLVMYLAHKHAGLSSPAIGQRLNREHATVLHGVRNVEKRMSVSGELGELISAIESELLGGA